MQKFRARRRCHWAPRTHATEKTAFRAERKTKRAILFRPIDRARSALSFYGLPAQKDAFCLENHRCKVQLARCYGSAVVSDDALGTANGLFTKNRRPTTEKRFGQSIEKDILYKMAAFLCAELT